MEVRLIRHFATEGNLEKRYIGVTDEEIKAEFVLEHTLKKEENGQSFCIRWIIQRFRRFM